MDSCSSAGSSGSSGSSGANAASAADTDHDVSSPSSPEATAAGLVDQATDPTTGTIDTQCLAEHVADVAAVDMAAASVAYDAIESTLAERSLADVSRFNEDVVSAVGAATFGAGQGLATAGRSVLEQNPQLTKSWESTRSAWTGKGGFTPGLENLLSSNGIDVSARVNAPPAGSVTKHAGVPSAVANNTNGALARDAIADRFRAAGLDPLVEQPRLGGARVVDVVVDVPATDPRHTQRIEVESKVGRKGLDPETRRQAALDAQSLAQNRATRQVGQVLENVGRVARPVGLALDAVSIGQAYRADGNRVGSNTGRTASGVAGGALGAWGGAAAGAALGTAVMPGVGTVVGGIIGGIAGGLGGDAAGKGLFDTVRSWF